MTHNDIASASDSDTEAVVALWEACGLTRPWNDPRADISLALKTPASDVLVLRDERGLLASAMGGETAADETATDVEQKRA